MDADKQKVESAVKQLQQEFAGELSDFGFRVFPEYLKESYGGWLLPGELSASPAVRKSYALHQLIEKLENYLMDQTQATITIDPSGTTKEK